MNTKIILSNHGGELDSVVVAGVDGVAIKEALANLVMSVPTFDLGDRITIIETDELPGLATTGRKADVEA